MDIISKMLAVFTSIGDWLITSLQSFMNLFWTPAAESGGSGSLTVFGGLAIAGLGISVVMMLFKVIQNFLHLRG